VILFTNCTHVNSAHFSNYTSISYVLSFAKSHVTKTPSDRRFPPEQRNQLLTIIWQTQETRRSEHSDLVESKSVGSSPTRQQVRCLVWGSALLHWFIQISEYFYVKINFSMSRMLHFGTEMWILFSSGKNQYFTKEHRKWLSWVLIFFLLNLQQTIYTDNREKAGNGVISILASDNMV